MGRLTEKPHGKFIWSIKECKGYNCNSICGNMDSCFKCPIQEAINKLAKYEDFEEIFRSKMTDEAYDLLKDKEEFKNWLDRIVWTAKRFDEYARAEASRKTSKESEETTMKHKVTIATKEEKTVEEYWILTAMYETCYGPNTKETHIGYEKKYDHSPTISEIAQFLSDSQADFVAASHNYRFAKGD